MAAIAKGWIDDHLPADMGAVLLDMVEQWLARGDLSLGTLWRLIIDSLHGLGGFDVEIEACRLALSLLPGQSFFQLRLAEMLRRSGRSREAREVLAGIQGDDEVQCRALLQLLMLEDEAPSAKATVLDDLEARLLLDGGWSDRHMALITQMAKRGLVDRVSAFIGQWTEKWRVTPADFADMGVVAMMAGDPRRARSFFMPLWCALGHETRIGWFDGTIRPYDDSVEAALVGRIEAAFARDEASLPVLDLGHHSLPADGKVMMLSFGHRSLPNDLTEHFAASAADAGVDLQLYLDTAVAMAADFRGSDEEVAARVEAFVAEVELSRPDVLIIDCFPYPALRGINPGFIAGLKARLGFRLVCVMRDAHKDVVFLLDQWLPHCDTMVVFDPLSPIFGPDRAPENRKVTAMPVPSLHAPFLDHQERDLGLTFVGSVNLRVRYMLLSVLMTEDIGLTAVFGARRAIETPDTAAYARFLARSRATLNISVHGPGQGYDCHLITGRVWEAIAAGSLLVEQDNPATAMVFTPYRHYLPWTTVEDIVHIARFIERRPDLAARIVGAAHAWARRHYSSDRFWAGVLGRQQE